MKEVNELHTPTYYTCMEQLIEVFEREGRKKKLVAHTLSEFESWKLEVRELLIQLTGINKMQWCELKTQVIERVELEEFIREKVLLQVEPHVWMPVYVLYPHSIEKGVKRPCVIAAHGHLGAGKYAVAGRVDIPSVKEKIEHYNYDYGVQLVKEGYIVFCPDARGFGERRESTKQTDQVEDFITSTCSQLSNMALPLGRTVAGMCTWDLMRLIDYIETRIECDLDKLGCVGFSGGGMQTLWLAALDERIKCGVTSGYFYGYKDALLKLSGNCACNYVPHLWEYIDMGDLAALIAPRPLLIQSAQSDKLNGERGLENVLEQMNILKQAYSLFEQVDDLEHDVVEGGHKWHTPMPIKFIKKHLTF
ncbi:MAG: dienelactone hydrolase family protein [Cellulosilyticaceae bacterium]